MRHLFICLASIALLAVSCQEPIPEIVLGGIAGVVSDKTTGEPVPTVNVKITETGAATVTGSDGSFTFRNLESGRYTLTLSKEGYKDNSGTVTVSDGKTIESHLLIERIPAVLTLDREVLDFGDNASNTTLSFSMVNKNYVAIDWEIVYNCNWIAKVDPAKSLAKLAMGRTQTVVVTIDRSLLQAGENKTVIVVRTDDGSSELTVTAIGQEKKLPALNISETTDIRATSAVLNAEITEKGIPEYTERGFVLGDKEMPTKETAIKIIPATVDAAMKFSVRAGDLTLEQTYYVRAYAENNAGIAYSTNQDKFTTECIAPKLENFVVISEDKETRTAVFSATIAYVGDPPYYSRGFYWNTVDEGEITENSEIEEVEGTSTTFQKSITFPSADQPIYVGAYVANVGWINYWKPVEIFSLEYLELKSSNLGVQKSDVNENQLDWYEAVTACKNSRVGSLSDWRLPTKDELYQLYLLKDEIGGFHSQQQYDIYWSSEIDADISSASLQYYYCIDFYNGKIYSARDNNGGYGLQGPFYARCVRTLNSSQTASRSKNNKQSIHK